LLKFGVPAPQKQRKAAEFGSPNTTASTYIVKLKKIYTIEALHCSVSASPESKGNYTVLLLCSMALNSGPSLEGVPKSVVWNKPQLARRGFLSSYFLKSGSFFGGGLLRLRHPVWRFAVPV
jgi:hypothetical protein